LLFLFSLVLADPTFPLFNAALPGLSIPAIGLGTAGYGSVGNVGGEFWDDDTAATAVNSWLSLGGVRIDSSLDYNNSVGVGRGIALSKRSRQSIFITSKTGPRYPLGYDETLKQTDEILKELQTDYVDLLLLHWPGPYTVPGNWSCYQNQTSFKKCRQDSWRALETLFLAGKAHAIGVSNFEKIHLEDIFELKSLIPSVNQVEFHPYWHEDALVQFCKDNKILYNSYCSVGCPDHMKPTNNPNGWKTQVIEQPSVLQIAQKYKKTPAQVVLHWSFQQDLIVNARSWSPAHQAENLDIFDFSLTVDEMTLIGSLPLPPNPKVCYDPNTIL